MQLHPLLAPPLRRGLGPTLLSTPSELQQAEADLPRRRRKRHGKFGTRQAISHIEISILLKIVQEFYLPIFKCTYAHFFIYWFELFWDKYMGAGEFSLWFFQSCIANTSSSALSFWRWWWLDVSPPPPPSAEDGSRQRKLAPMTCSGEHRRVLATTHQEKKVWKFNKSSIFYTLSVRNETHISSQTFELFG